jgi:hypothetical protein
VVLGVIDSGGLEVVCVGVAVHSVSLVDEVVDTMAIIPEVEVEADIAVNVQDSPEASTLSINATFVSE